MIQHKNQPQRGNILFLILLAVVLFAALTVAVGRGERGQVKDISAERASTLAAQLVQHASLIENTVLRSMTIDGIPDYGFDFSGLSNSSANSTCTVSACKIFSGKASPLLIPEWASIDTSNSRATFRTPVVIDVGTSQPDLIIYYTHLKTAVCEAINQNLGISVNLALPESFGTAGGYTATLTSFPTEQGMLGDEVVTLKGRRGGCFYNGSVGNVFYWVLLAR